MSEKVSVMQGVRARLAGQSAWRVDRYGNWVLGQRRFKVTRMTLRYERKVGDRWAAYCVWYFGRVKWNEFESMKRAAETRWEKAQSAAPAGVDPDAKVQVKENEQHGGVEVQFSGKPPQIVLDSLHNAGFRWSRRQRLWYAKRAPERLAFAGSLLGPPAPAPVPGHAPTAPVLIASDGSGFAGAVERSGDVYRGHVNGQPVEAPAGAILPALQEVGATEAVGVSEPVHQMGVVITG